MLSLAWFCGDAHLPEAGGVMDQDYSTMRQMSTLTSIYRAKQAAPRYTGKKIHDMPADMKRIIKWLRESGLWDG